MGVTINNNITTDLERTAASATGGLNAYYLYQIIALDSAFVEVQGSCDIFMSVEFQRGLGWSKPLLSLQSKYCLKIQLVLFVCLI